MPDLPQFTCPHSDSFEATLRYSDTDVRETFPGFKGPKRNDSTTLNTVPVRVEEVDNGSDGCNFGLSEILGLVGLRIGSVVVSMDPATALRLARHLEREAEIQAAYVDDESDESDASGEARLLAYGGRPVDA